jgi:NTE family protein
MAMATKRKTRAARTTGTPGPHARSAQLPGQVVLVLQGGGAIGVYQVGVYQALHDAGIEPNWVIGTSIGAINGALIAGNPPAQRMERLEAFWGQVEQQAPASDLLAWLGMGGAMSILSTMARGVPGFFAPNPAVWQGPQARLGVDAASYYSTAPLRETLESLVDFDYLNACPTRFTVGAVNVRSGSMRYFDSREEHLGPEHVMASGALPPAFPAIRIDGEYYWDGGLYSNTPIEAVLDDNPRRDSVIFAVNVWQPEGPAPESIWQVLGRQKDIQYSSRAQSHIARQKQIHHLRHVIRELYRNMPASKQSAANVRELAAWGCGTVMHVVRLLAPRLEGEDHMKDIDFTPAGVRARWQSGLEDTRAMIARAPWTVAVDPMEGVIEHLAAECQRPDLGVSQRPG